MVQGHRIKVTPGTGAIAIENGIRTTPSQAPHRGAIGMAYRTIHRQNRNIPFDMNCSIHALTATGYLLISAAQ